MLHTHLPDFVPDLTFDSIELCASLLSIQFLAAQLLGKPFRAMSLFSSHVRFPSNPIVCYLGWLILNDQQPLEVLVNKKSRFTSGRDGDS